MKKYIKPIIVDENIEINDVCYNSVSDAGDVEENDND